MKRAIFPAVLFLLQLSVCASLVDFEFSYDVYLYSCYRQDGEDYIKMAQSQNENVSTFFNAQAPYNGGSDFQHRQDIERYQLAGLFLDRTGISNWTINDIVGTLSIGTSEKFSQGTLVPFKVFYEYAELEHNPTVSGITAEISLWTDNFMNEVYSVGGNTVTEDLIYLTAGHNYDFYARYSIGSRNNLFTGQYVGGILYNFEVVPEPATLGLLGIGTLLIRKRIEGRN